ncbi:MAG TPA: hypothetical protein VID04_12805 [Methylomirabilota bacterium]|jgi:hypothetical protein
MRVRSENQIRKRPHREDHVGNGVSDRFVYDFLVLQASDLKVFVSEVQVLTGFTVTGVGNPCGGSVEFDGAPADQAPVALIRDVPYTQETDSPVDNKFASETHGRALDRATMLVQRLKEILGRGFKLKTWDATGMLLVLVTVLTLGAFPNPLLGEGRTAGARDHRVALGGHLQLSDYPTQTFRNLRLGTHPDAPDDLSKVRLFGADEIVMNDGFRSTDWPVLTADITASGAGGLDTGSEENATWYEIHAIRKSSDGARHIMYHKSDHYALDQFLVTGNDAFVALRRSSAPHRLKQAQGFTPSVPGTLPYVDLLLKLPSTTPTGNMWVTIEGSNGGVPDNTSLATSDKIRIRQLATSIPNRALWVRFVFRTPPALTASTLYHIVLQADYTQSDTVVLSWGCDASSPPYPGGARSTTDNGTSWTANSTRDFLFRAWIKIAQAALTMPPGYDQNCLIGFVFNNSSGNHHQFYARDKSVIRPVWNAGIAQVVFRTNQRDTAYPGAVLDMTSFIPPRAYRVRVGVETGYTSNPGAIQQMQANIRTEFPDTDIIRVNHLAPPSAGNLAMAEADVDFPEIGGQVFRYLLASTDVAANKTILIAAHGYEWR